MKHLLGETVSHYRIIEEIGQGGMGVVFRAEDTKLRRNVALKFLPPELTRDAEARSRFIQEAQSASALQHNNICTVHDIDQTNDGQMFIVMDLYEGETLKKKIEKGPIVPEEAVGIAIQIGQGLARAHERGIVHRDIKPANILLTDDGAVKILDFGLAKLGAGAMLTRAGTTLGTTAYMSPEQTRGEDVDRRTDIWSLGVILYQMLTGKLPFNADHDQAIIYAIQNSEPVFLSSSGIPAGCQQLLAKALQKDPGARYLQVSEFVADLRTLLGISAAGGSSIGPQSIKAVTRRRVGIYGSIAVFLTLLVVGIFFIRRGSEKADTGQTDTRALRRLAVLPFANLRSDPQTDFLGFALADQIIGNLANVKTLLVRPSSAIRKYQTETADVAAAGQALNVDLVLTGNYLKESNIIRLSLELVDIHTNAILWREAMQEEYENAFKLEDAVARKVVTGLQVQFAPEELRQAQANIPRNPLAYDYYLHGISYPVSMEGNQRAVSMFRQAIALDSTYAPAFNQLGFRLVQIATYSPGQHTLTLDAESACLKALSLNSGMLSAYGTLAGLYTDIGQTEQAYETAQKVLSINPNSPEGHFFLGYICRYAGFLNKAEREMEKALSLDPGNPRFRSISIVYVYMGKYEAALRALDLDSSSSFSLAWKGNVYIYKNQPELALPYLNRVLEREPNSAFGAFCEEMKFYIERKYDLAKAALRRREESEKPDGEQWYNIAQFYGLLNEAAGAARTLRRAIHGGFFNYPLMLKDPLFDNVRGDADFQGVVAMAKTKYEAFKRRYPELQEET